MSTDLSTKKRPNEQWRLIPQRKQLILDFIHEFRRVKEISPRIKEITMGIGYSNASQGQVHTYINQLIDEGWLRRVDGASARALLPAKPATESYAKITDPDCIAIKKRQRNLKILRRL